LVISIESLEFPEISGNVILSYSIFSYISSEISISRSDILDFKMFLVFDFGYSGSNQYDLVKYNIEPTTVQAIDLAIEFTNDENAAYQKYFKHSSNI